MVADSKKTGAGESDSPILDQDELDALIAQMTGAEPVAAPAGPPEEPAPVTAKGDESGLLDQAELDALLAGIGSSSERAAAPEPRAEPEPEEPGATIDQAELDALIASMAGDPGEETVADDVRPVEEVVPSDVEPEPDHEPAEVKTLSQEELDELLSGASAEEPLDNKNLDTVLAGPEAAMDAPITDSETDAGLISQADLDSLLEAAKSGRQAPAPPPAPAPVPKPVAVPEPTVDENLAAAGTIQARPDAEEAEEAVEAVLKGAAAAVERARRASPPEEDLPEAGPVIEEAEAVKERARRIRRKPIRLPLPSISARLAVKVAASLAAGLLCAYGAYVFLNSLEYRPADLAALTAQESVGLEQVMRAARARADEGAYRDAVELLDAALTPGVRSPLRADAEFLRIEASFRAMPEMPTDHDAELLNSRINTFVENNRSHPRVVDALMMKAHVYERKDVPFLALGAYEDILANFTDIPREDRVLFDGARVALQVGRADDAADLARRLLSRYPASPLVGQARLVLGEALVRAGRGEEGRDLMRQVAAAQSHTALGAEAYARLGQLALDDGQYEEAIALLDGRLRSATTIAGNDQVMFMLARALRAVGRHEDAQNTLRDLLEFFPESPLAPEAMIALSEVLDDLGRRDQALRVAAQASQRFPRHPRILVHHARLRELAGDPFGASQDLLAADKAGADDPQLLLMAAGLLAKSGRSAEALQTLNDIERRFPGSPQALIAGTDAARIAFERGQTRAALLKLETLARVTQNTPQQTPVLLTLGGIYLDLGFVERAADVYRDVAAATSEPESLAKAAVALFATGAWEEGAAVAQRVDVERLTDPVAFRFLAAYGQALLRADPDRGLALMQRAYAEYPEQRTLQDAETLMKALVARDRVADARVLLAEIDRAKTALTVEPVRRIAIVLGDHLFNKGDFRAAADAYAVAVDAGVEETIEALWAMYQRGNALARTGDVEGSRALLERVAASRSDWAKGAQLRLDYIALRQRLRGESAPGASQEG